MKSASTHAPEGFKCPHCRLFVPADRAVLLGIAFGWPDRTHRANSYRTTRAGVEEVTRWVDD